MSLCYGCFKEINKNLSFCRNCVKKVFDNHGINPVQGFNKKDYIDIKQQIGERLSISGIQDKMSLRIENNTLIPVEKDGRYILKPVPQTIVPRFKNDIPANEHLTMQIAKQIFKISTAENALLRFNDGEPAYIVKRFDVRDGSRLHQEDFCQLLNMSEESHGKTYKYDLSYEEAIRVIDLFTSAKIIQKERFFNLILFNYIFSNGDAHLKNFSLIESPQGDFVLSPLYDALSTSVHFPYESRTALDFFKEFESESYAVNGFYTRVDFLEFGKKAGIKEHRIEKFIDVYIQKKDSVFTMIEKSFLSDEAKKAYRDLFIDRLKAMRI